MSHSPESSSKQPSADSIAALLPRGRAGDRAALDLLLTRYRPYLRVICTLRLPQICQRREDASDIVQQTLMDAARGLSEFRGESAAEFEAWMARLLERNILQSVRRNTAEMRDVRRETVDWRPTDSAQLVWYSLAGNQSSPESSVFRGEAALELAQALESLPDDQRMAVELRYLGQQPLKSIAEYMSKSTGAVAGLIRRGIEHLRNALPTDFLEAS